MPTTNEPVGAVESNFDRFMSVGACVRACMCLYSIAYHYSVMLKNKMRLRPKQSLFSCEMSVHPVRNVSFRQRRAHRHLGTNKRLRIVRVCFPSSVRVCVFVRMRGRLVCNSAMPITDVTPGEPMIVNVRVCVCVCQLVGRADGTRPSREMY